jgi:hypothetical protein
MATLLFRISCGGLNWGGVCGHGMAVNGREFACILYLGLDLLGEVKVQNICERGVAHETREREGQTDLLMLCVVIGRVRRMCSRPAKTERGWKLILRTINEQHGKSRIICILLSEINIASPQHFCRAAPTRACNVMGPPPFSIPCERVG